MSVVRTAVVSAGEPENVDDKEVTFKDLVSSTLELYNRYMYMDKIVALKLFCICT